MDTKDTATIVSASKTRGPIRITKNQAALKHIELDEDPSVDLHKLEAYTIPSLVRAARDGDTDNEIVTFGQIAGLITDVRPVKEIVATMFAEANQVIDTLQYAKL